MFEKLCEIKPKSKRENVSLPLFFFKINISDFAPETHISSRLILSVLIGLSMEYYGDVMFYYFV